MLYLVGPAPPRFMMEREGILSVHQGKEVELLCRASGDDPISISWRKGGRDLVAQPGQTIRPGTLRPYTLRPVLLSPRKKVVLIQCRYQDILGCTIECNKEYQSVL